MGLKSFYYRQEEKYFAFLDRLEKKGINLYKIVDPLEKNGIPTFLLFNLIILLLIVFLAFLLFGSSVVTDQTYSLTFVDSQNKPISNESLEILFNNSPKLLVTNSLGIAEVTGIKKEEMPLGIKSSKYQIETPLTINFSKKNNYPVYLKLTVSTVSKTIYFKSNNELYNSPLTVSTITCSNNSNYRKNNLLTNDGSLTLTDIPADCGYLQVSIESSTVNAVGSVAVNEDGLSGDVELSFAEKKTGNASIKVLDNDLKTPISNVSVSIVNMQSQVVREATTNTNGIVLFENITIGTYRVVIYDNDDRYRPITELENIQITIVDSALQNKDVLLTKAYIGQLKFKVIDSKTKEAIENVSVSLYKTSTLVKTLISNKEGLVNFGVEENITYKVVFNNPNYILKTENNLRISDSVKQISLNPITNENLRSLVITVQDNLLKPVDFATIRLWDAEENIILQTITADVYGKAVLTNLDISRTYKLDSSKGQFTSEFTNPFRIVEQQINEQVIKMTIGEGTFNLTLKTEFGDFYQGNVYVYDTLNDSILADKTTSTNAEGFTLIKIRADKQVYFVIDNFDSKFITSRYEINANEIVNLSFTLPSRISQTSGIEFLGFYNALGEKINSVTPGMQVTARYSLNVTKKFSKVVAHLRIGNAPNPVCGTTTYTVLEDALFIKEVRYAKSETIGSTSYTPCSGQTTDLSNKTLRNAKWFNLTINNPLEGSYLIEADVVVLESAFINQALNYRAEFYEGTSIVRSPVDTSYTSGNTKQNLYAQTKQAMLFTGSQNQCSSLLCYAFTITSNQTNLSRNIIDRYNAQINNDYRLSFNLNVLEGKIAPNSTMVITTGSSVVLKEYMINSVTGNLLRGNEFSNIEIGSLTSNDILSGDIDFKVIDDVSDVITISIVSNGQEVFSRNIFIDVKEAKEMYVEMVPRKIIPFIANDLMIAVTDHSNKPVNGANVNILLNNNPLVVSLTNSQGLYGYVLPATDLGDVVRIIVTKNEYRMKDISLVVDDQLITAIPKEITLTLDSSVNVREVYNFSLFNEAYVPLSIVSVSQSLDNQYVKLALDIENYTINGNSQNDITLTATLTEAGMNLYTQQTIKNEVAIRIRSEEMNKTWLVTIPVTVRVVLGNALDSLDCLKVLPSSASIRTEADKTVTFDFTVENKCTSRQIAIDLTSINAMADWGNESEAGVLSIVVSGKEYILEDLKEVSILSSLLKNAKSTLQLKFKAYKIASNIKTPTIYFTSKKGNINGVDEVKARLPLEVIVNNYAECIEMPKQPVPALACNWFSGFNNYNQYYGGNNFSSGYNNPYFGGNNFNTPYNMNNQFNPHNTYQAGQGYFTQQQGYRNPNYNLVGQFGYAGPQASTVNPYNFPTAQYQNTFGNYNSYNFMSGYPQDNYGNMGMSNNMNCPVRPFYIKNNCLEGVTIKLDASYGVTITSDAEFSLEPGESKETTILGGESMGTFNIPVNVKPSLVNKANYRLVGNVPVSVTLPISFMPSKCIQVTPQKLDFSNILDPKYQMVKVMNTCFADGYRLVEVSYLDLMDLDFDGVSFLTVGEMQGKIQPIKVDTFTELTTNKPIEYWEIALRRNPEIKNTVSAKEYLNKYSQYSLAAGIVSSFRKILIDVEDTVNLKFVLQVGLQPPHGQSSLIYNNVGMQLTDNFQWLILDNKDNWDLIKQFTDENVTDEDMMFVDTSVKLTYTLDSENKAVMIHVPENQLTADKFKRMDQETEVTRCFFGYVKDFPLNGIKDTSYINDNGTYYLKDTYNPLKVSIRFLKPTRHIFKLCFTRPVDSFNNVLAVNSKITIYDLFKEGQTSNINKVFELWASSENQKAKLESHISIGVSTAVSDRSIDGSVTPTADGETIATGALKCLAPDLSSNLGQTGLEAYNDYGFDKILFEYDSSKITATSCDNMYCDQEQFYDYLQKKVVGLDSLKDTSKYVKLGDIYFEKDWQTIKRSDIKVDFCGDGDVCEDFNRQGKETLQSYIDEAVKLLNSIPQELREITIIKTKGLEYNPSGDYLAVVTIGDYQYTTAEYFLNNLHNKFSNDNQRAEVYANMEVYFGSSPQVFTSSLKKFGQTNDPLNVNILNTYNSSTVVKTYEFTYERAMNVSKPGVYLIHASQGVGKNVVIKIRSLVRALPDEYNKNILFSMPINPRYTMSKSNTLYNAPFLSGIYNVTDYSSTDTIQDGYIFSFKDMANYTFIDSRPFYFNKPYNFKIVQTNNNTDLKVLNNMNRLFLLKDKTSLQVALYANPQINNGDTKNVTAFTKTVVSNNFMIYNLVMNNVEPKLTYNTMNDVFKEIPTGNVCFNISGNNPELLLWHNPDKFK